MRSSQAASQGLKRVELALLSFSSFGLIHVKNPHTLGRVWILIVRKLPCNTYLLLIIFINRTLPTHLTATKTLQADYHDLYWAVGDTGPQEDPNDHGQRTDILFGSIVRISVPSDGTGYKVPSDNYPGAGDRPSDKMLVPQMLVLLT